MYTPCLKANFVNVKYQNYVQNIFDLSIITDKLFSQACVTGDYKSVHLDCGLLGL